jgi:predicted RNA-binding Zn ribbon-like protein
MADLRTTPADEQLLLSLLNTTPVVNGEMQDELGDLATARKWLAAHGQNEREQEWRTLLELRPVLQDVVRGNRSPRDLAPFLEGVGYRPLVTESGLEWVLDAPEGRTAAAQVVIAWQAVRTSSPGRLRACANPDCRLFLIDHSKANGAKWCSMAVCGNRMKARRHYHRADDAVEQTSARR